MRKIEPLELNFSLWDTLDSVVCQNDIFPQKSKILGVCNSRHLLLS